jgi:hypothetical protein
MARSSRHRRRRFTTRVYDIDFTVTGSVLVPITKVPCGCKESDARSLRGGEGELGNLKTLTYGFTIFTQR